MVRPERGKRISKIDTYLNCAEVFAYRSTCIKRKYGAVIVKDDVVISTGYNGAPRGVENCCDLGKCPRIERDMHQGDGYGICRAVQSLILGPLYVIVIGIPSTLWGFVGAKKRKDEQIPYGAFVTEGWANRLGERVTGEKSIDMLVLD